MMSTYRGAVCIFRKYTQNNIPLMLDPINCPNNFCQQIRTIKKHFNQKWCKQRQAKFRKIKDIPNQDVSKMSHDEMRSMYKSMGILPQRDWSERPVLITCSPSIFEEYVVPEGDGKFSILTKEGSKQKLEFIHRKGKSFMAIRKIKQFDQNFSTTTFIEEALNIYQKAHEAMAAKVDEMTLLQYVTETAYPLMVHNMMDKTIHWKFLESLEPARVVHARAASIISKDNVFAQITVRFHTQQLLCLYDRFGRVLKGSEVLRKDVLDYIVFEKHMSNHYGAWRIHSKIIPSWMPPEEMAAKTYQLKKQEESVAKTDRPKTFKVFGAEDTEKTPSTTL